MERQNKDDRKVFVETEPDSLEYEYEPGIGLSAMKFSEECEMITRGVKGHCKKCRCNETPAEGHCISCPCHQESGLALNIYISIQTHIDCFPLIFQVCCGLSMIISGCMNSFINQGVYL